MNTDSSPTSRTTPTLTRRQLAGAGTAVIGIAAIGVGTQASGRSLADLVQGSATPQAGDDGFIEPPGPATSAGHLLAFPVSELPELDKGKGNKLIDIPKAKLGTERVVAVAAVGPGQSLLVHSGQRTMTLSFKDLDGYLGARATRGGLLPRGWQKVDGLGVE